MNLNGGLFIYFNYAFKVVKYFELHSCSARLPCGVRSLGGRVTPDLTFSHQV